MLGFVSFARCDQSNKLNGYSKSSCWKFFRSSNESILEAFRALGENLSPLIFDGLENFVMDLRCPNRPSTISNIKKLWWYMFSKFQCESEKLPPSKSTPREKIFRSRYTSLVWKSDHLPSPVSPDPKEFGWRWNSSQKSYESIMTKNSFHFWVHYWTMNMKMQDRLYQP